MKQLKPIVIAIAAVSGGGKTTITSQLSQVLKNAKAIYFDDYDFDGPTNIIDWVERGADCNEWNITPLIADIEKIMASESYEFILLDYPFARLHHKLREIDLVIFIDTPLDIAMARRILRDFGDSSAEAIRSDLRNYLERGRVGYESMLKTTKPNSDVLISGLLSTDEIVQTIMDEMKRRL